MEYLPHDWQSCYDVWPVLKYKGRGPGENANASMNRSITLSSSRLSRHFLMPGTGLKLHFFPTVHTRTFTSRVPKQIVQHFSSGSSLQYPNKSLRKGRQPAWVRNMATATRVKVTASDTGVFSTGVRADSAEAASEVLQENLEKDHIYFNLEGFHSEYQISPRAVYLELLLLYLGLFVDGQSWHYLRNFQLRCNVDLY
jgi:hypothetical protein